MFWLYKSVLSSWDTQVLKLMEERLITLVQVELDFQKELEK